MAEAAAEDGLEDDDAEAEAEEAPLLREADGRAEEEGRAALLLATVVLEYQQNLGG